MRCTPKRIIGLVLIWQFAIMGAFLLMFAPEHKVFQRLEFHRKERAYHDTSRIHRDGGIRTPFLPKTTLHRVLVSNRYKTLFCYVPKVACSNWKRVFLILEGHFNTTAEINESYVHNLELEIDSLRNYPKMEVDLMLQTYKKVVFVREPMERILSAYLNKFAHDNEDRKYHHKYGIEIIQKYRKNFTGEVTDELYTTFNEFVQYLIDLEPLHEKRDEHWNLQYNLCSPYIINYDFIGKYDNLKSDAARALEFIGASDVITFPATTKLKPKGQQTKALMKKFYSLITEEEFNQLLKVYDKDYETFGFYKPSYLEVIGQLSSKARWNKTKDITSRFKGE